MDARTHPDIFIMAANVPLRDLLAAVHYRCFREWGNLAETSSRQADLLVALDHSAVMLLKDLGEGGGHD